MEEFSCLCYSLTPPLGELESSKKRPVRLGREAGTTGKCSELREMGTFRLCRTPHVGRPSSNLCCLSKRLSTPFLSFFLLFSPWPFPQPLPPQTKNSGPVISRCSCLVTRVYYYSPAAGCTPAFQTSGHAIWADKQRTQDFHLGHAMARTN